MTTISTKPVPPWWELFEHGADIGIRRIAPTLHQAFEQAAMALTAVITNPDQVSAVKTVSIRCQAPDNELLLLDWIRKFTRRLLMLHRYRGLLKQLMP